VLGSRRASSGTVGDDARAPCASAIRAQFRSRLRPAGATGQLLPPVFSGPTRSALRRASLEHSFGPEGGAGQAVRGGLERAPAGTVRVPGSRPPPAPGPLTRAASPDRGGRLGAQFEAQGVVKGEVKGEVLPVT